MLVWLNGNQNVRQKPNENYARELMELFTLGANRGAYTETDVREQARALTGWRGNVVNRQSTGVHLQRRAPRHRARRRSSASRATTAGRTRASSASTTRCTRRSSSRSSGATSSRRRSTARPSKALQERYASRQVQPVVEAILLHPDFYDGPRMAKPPVVLQRRPAADARPLHRHVDLVDARPAGGPAALLPAGRRRLGRLALARHGDVPRALVHRRARAGRLDAARQPERSGAARSTARSRSGARPRSRRRRRACSRSFAAAQLKRKIAAGNVETALRRLIATSPDLQTA